MVVISLSMYIFVIIFREEQFPADSHIKKSNFELKKMFVFYIFIEKHVWGGVNGHLLSLEFKFVP